MGKKNILQVSCTKCSALCGSMFFTIPLWFGVFLVCFCFCNLICEMAVVGKKALVFFYFKEVGKFRTAVINVLVLSQCCWYSALFVTVLWPAVAPLLMLPLPASSAEVSSSEKALLLSHGL